MELLCKTRGNSSPDGKTRVYFYSHPEDFNLYFSEISDEILGIVNCSLWYKKDPSKYIENDFELTLGQMQLIVIPVTYRFLDDYKSINSKELVFIKKAHPCFTTFAGNKYFRVV